MTRPSFAELLRGDFGPNDVRIGGRRPRIVAGYVPNPGRTTRCWGETIEGAPVAFLQVDAEPWTSEWFAARRTVESLVRFFAAWS